MSATIEGLKEMARTHEQKEDWSKALGLYKKAIDQLAAEEQSDIGLYNRVADLMVRQGQLREAVQNYEKAIDLYLEAELPNNAIAVCRKIVRNMPQRHTVYLRMGQIRGKQGLLADARQNFVIYAERMQAVGNVDEGLRALTELADLSPADPDIRLGIATQMQAQGRTEDAVAQLQAGYRAASSRGLPTQPFAQMMEQFGVEPDRTPDAPASAVGESASVDIELGDFEITMARSEPEGAQEEAEEEQLPTFEFSPAEEDAAPLAMLDEGEDATPLPMLDDEEDATPLPYLVTEEEVAEDSGPLPLMSDAFEGPALSEPVLDAFSLEPAATLSPPPSPSLPPRPFAPPQPSGAPGRGVSSSDPMGYEMLAARGDLAGAMTSLRKLTKLHPDDLALAQRLVDYASQLADPAALAQARLELADTMRRSGQAAKAGAIYEQVLELEPQNPRALAALGRASKFAAPPSKAPSEGFVDLASMLMDDEEEKTTRFVVAYEEPTGDEQADFARMLSQFKAKVAENLSASDVKAHQDLGTAYKEMGLLDDAIGEFQQALRASQEHLPTYELLGQCFMEKGEPDAAVRTLNRALEAPYEVEDELLGIYYYLARAYEQLGNTKEALEFYDRVFSLDINFADVTERLRTLR